MKPAPQYLPAVLDQFSDEQLFVILEKGVMMSAMPPWIAEGRPDEIWSVVAFLRAMEQGLTAGEYNELTVLPPRTGPAIRFEAPPNLTGSAVELPLAGDGE